MACLAIVYFTTAARDGVHIVLGRVEFCWGLDTGERYLWRVKPLVNIILMSYGLHIFWILSARPLTYCGEFSVIVLYPSILVSWSQCYALWVVVVMEVVSLN